MPHYALIMLAAGIGIPVLAALNAGLGTRIGSPAAAATILFVIALGISLCVALITGPQAFGRIVGTPLHLFLAGCFVAFYILSITYIAPSSSALGNARFLSSC